LVRAQEPNPRKAVTRFVANQKPENLEQVLNSLRDAEHRNGRVTVASILKTIGCRSFGPVLLFAALVMMAPGLGDIPGVPILAGSLICLVSIQLLFRRDHVWLPKWLLRRSASKKNVDRAVRKLRKPARFVDRFLRHRLEVLTKGRMAQLILAVALLISAATPLMEFVPFSANVAGLALTAFGLALIAHDGVFAICAYVFTAAAAAVVVWNVV
jgi:hypothetical protein